MIIIEGLIMAIIRLKQFREQYIRLSFAVIVHWYVNIIELQAHSRFLLQLTPSSSHFNAFVAGAPNIGCMTGCQPKTSSFTLVPGTSVINIGQCSVLSIIICPYHSVSWQLSNEGGVCLSVRKVFACQCKRVSIIVARKKIDFKI